MKTRRWRRNRMKPVGKEMKKLNREYAILNCRAVSSRTLIRLSLTNQGKHFSGPQS